MSFESSVFSFRSASGGTNKRKDFRFKSTHDAPPNSKVSLILALPQSRQMNHWRIRFSFTPSTNLNSSSLLVFSHGLLANRHRQLQRHKFLSPWDTSSLRSAGREMADSSLSAPVSPMPVCTHWLVCKRLQSRRLYPCQLTRCFKRSLTLCWPGDSIYKSFIFPTGSQLLRRRIRLQ